MQYYVVLYSWYWVISTVLKKQRRMVLNQNIATGKTFFLQNFMFSLEFSLASVTLPCAHNCCVYLDLVRV